MVFVMMFSLAIPASATSIRLSKTSTTIYVGSSTTLKVTGTTRKVSWSTSKKSVATVSSKGKVTARKAGSATIRAKVAGKTLSCKVTVKNVALNKSKVTLYSGSSTTLKLYGGTIKSVKSSKTSVATISKSGKLTAKKAGSATIYGTTGGVAEAVVRYCLPDKSKNTLRELQYSALRGNESIREATVQIGEREIKLAVVHGLINAQKLLKEIEAGTAYYDLVEVMPCPSGCVGGAGQPYGLTAAKKRRGAGLYEADSSAMFKRAEKNPIVTRLLDDYGPDRCHQLLHVHYGEE